MEAVRDLRYRRRAVHKLTRIALIALLGAACTHEVKPEPPKVPTPVIEAYSEPTAVTSIVAIGGAVFVGTSLGIDRWEIATGKHRRLDAIDGVPPGAAVRALALGRAGTLWFATDAGVGWYEIERSHAAMVPAPDKALAAAVTGFRALAVDKAGGVWVGGTGGLFHADVGGWAPTAFKREVTALYAPASGELWLGTRDGVVERNLGGVFTKQINGSTLKNVTAVGEGPDGAPVAIGEDAEGHSRIAAFLDGELSTYALSSEGRITQ